MGGSVPNFCPNCGGRLSIPKPNFCPNCGQNLKKQESIIPSLEEGGNKNSRKGNAKGNL